MSYAILEVQPPESQGGIARVRVALRGLKLLQALEARNALMREFGYGSNRGWAEKVEDSAEEIDQRITQLHELAFRDEATSTPAGMRAAEKTKAITELRARGPINSNPDECEHLNVYNEHCFDCGDDAEELICHNCKEWTSSLEPCC